MGSGATLVKRRAHSRDRAHRVRVVDGTRSEEDPHGHLPARCVHLAGGRRRPAAATRARAAAEAAPPETSARRFLSPPPLSSARPLPPPPPPRVRTAPPTP